MLRGWWTALATPGEALPLAWWGLAGALVLAAGAALQAGLWRFPGGTTRRVLRAVWALRSALVRATAKAVGVAVHVPRTRTYWVPSAPHRPLQVLAAVAVPGGLITLGLTALWRAMAWVPEPQPLLWAWALGVTALVLPAAAPAPEEWRVLAHSFAAPGSHRRYPRVYGGSHALCVARQVGGLLAGGWYASAPEALEEWLLDLLLRSSIISLLQQELGVLAEWWTAALTAWAPTATLGPWLARLVAWLLVWELGGHLTEIGGFDRDWGPRPSSTGNRRGPIQGPGVSTLCWDPTVVGAFLTPKTPLAYTALESRASDFEEIWKAVAGEDPGEGEPFSEAELKAEAARQARH